MNRGFSLKNYIVKRFGGFTLSEVEQSKKHAFESGLELADTYDDEPPLTDSSGKPIALGYANRDRPKRDLSSISQEKAIEASYRIWQTNPLGKALTETIVDYVVGDGIQIICDNEDVRNIVDKFLDDEVNRFNESGFQEITRELSLFGEQIILIFTRYGDERVKGDGRVRYGTADPSQIQSIITHPDNYRDIYAIRMKSENLGEDGPLYMVIREDVAESGINRMEGFIDLKRYKEAIDENGLDEANPMKVINLGYYQKSVPKNSVEYLVCENSNGELRRNLEAIVKSDQGKKDEKYEGQCFLVQVNKLSTGTRGRPDLLPMLDWLDQLDNVFFDGVEHIQLLNLFAWDLEVEGGSSDAIDPDSNLDIQAAKVSKLRSKSVYAHNENVKLEPKNPVLHATELETISRTLRIFIAGGARIPEHWLAEGGYTNRATAGEMGKPTFKMLDSRQRVISYLVERMIRYVIDVHVALGLLPEFVPIETKKGIIEQVPAREAFDIVMPEINILDTNSITTSLLRVVQAVVTAIAGKLIPRSVGMELLVRIIQMLGVEVDVGEMEAELEETEGTLINDLSGSESIKGIINLINQYISKSQSEEPNPQENENSQ